ncbi:MAG: ABC transporter ATP-binding protein NatA [Alphaproteobacteria bacterium MarineAlpha11_Bin1]|nr:MAG: ABC transporter ATP-binding protein NatA [Alphaproteobacteria bacterium MarineAlpha11_Bin1]|tara:strand:+ start:14819 stop:15583 length:765 start_codon:yes stop_codon:yes gene_type:complete
MVDAVIRVCRLVKRFGEVLAVNELSFDVMEGKICALLGGNGAGKTTTISMLLGLLIPTSGEIEILGADILRHRYKILPRINFSSPYVDLPKRLTSRENLMVYSKLYGIPEPKERITALALDLDIDDFLDRPFGELSSGQKTRVSLAKSLLNEPDLLFLDEPTASLDPDTADWVRTYLMEFQRDRKGTILLASHNMSEVERMCDDVVMMREGSIVDRGSPAALLTRYGRGTLEDVFLDISRGRVSEEDSEMAAEK